MKTRAIITTLAILTLQACGQSEAVNKKADPKPFPRNFPNVVAADKAVPKEERIAYQHLRSCRGDLAIASGKTVPTTTTTRIADLVDEIRRNPQALEECETALSRSKMISYGT